MLYTNLFTIVPDPKTGFYEIEESGFKYSFPPDRFKDLNTYFKMKKVAMVKDFYNALTQQAKDQIQKTAIVK